MKQFPDSLPLTKVVGLVGLPRSGTTMLNSVLGVHSRIEAIFEPWNRDDEDERAPDQTDLAEMVARFLPDREPGKDIVAIKETATHVRFLNFLANLLQSAQPPIQTDLILLWRNPLHIFLSEIEARRRWWDDASVEVSILEFDRWAGPRLGGLWRMLEIGSDFRALVVAYEGVVADAPRVIPAIMQQLGIEFEPTQLSFEKYLDRARVRGDITVATNPSRISPGRIQHRQHELSRVLSKIENAASYPYVKSVADVLSSIEKLDPVRLSDASVSQVANSLRELFKTWHRELGGRN